MCDIRFLFCVLITFSHSVFSQTNTENDIYNFESVVSLVNATENQKKIFEVAISERSTKLKIDSLTDKQKEAIEKDFHWQLRTIFDEEQQEVVFGLLVNKANVEKRGDAKYKKLIVSHWFPKKYKTYLKEVIRNYEFEFLRQQNKYYYEEEQRQEVCGSLTLEFDYWINLQQEASDDAVRKWKKDWVKYRLGKGYGDVYTSYHFYIELQDSSKLVTQKLHEIRKNQNLNKAIDLIALKETIIILGSSTRFQKLDSVSLDYAKQALHSFLEKRLLRNLTNNEPIKHVKENERFREIALKAGKEKQMELAQIAKQKEDEIFIARVQEAGLSIFEANQILGLIEKREKDLLALKSADKVTDSRSLLFENTSPKTSADIKREFAKNLSEIVDIKQFVKLFGDLFKQNTINKTRGKLKSLEDTYNLSDNQIKQVGKLVRNYYFRQELYTAYYSYDKTIRKQKLSMIRYKFEKAFQELMKKFDVEVKPVKKTNSRSFQW